MMMLTAGPPSLRDCHELGLPLIQGKLLQQAMEVTEAPAGYWWLVLDAMLEKQVSTIH